MNFIVERVAEERGFLSFALMQFHGTEKFHGTVLPKTALKLNKVT